MRSVVGITVAIFVAILVVAFYCSEKAHPQFIDVDPAAEPTGHH